MTRPWKNLATKWEVLKKQRGFRRAPLRTGSRLIFWRGRCLLRKASIVSLSKWDLQMYLPASWRGIAKFMFVFRDDYEPELAYLDTLLSPGGTFIDVGASFGIYSLVASKVVGPRGRVISFEPTSQSFAVLQRNIVLNRLTNILAMRLA